MYTSFRNSGKLRHIIEVFLRVLNMEDRLVILNKFLKVVTLLILATLLVDREAFP